MFKNSDFDNKMIPARYINRFISLNSLEEFGKYGLFPNPKEVTESFGMYYAAMRIVVENEPNITKKSNNVSVFAVGDGVTPRTAALFAFMTKWQCLSIDPALRPKDYSGIRRLDVCPTKVENAPLTVDNDGYHIILMPHAHVTPKVVYDKLANDKTWLINMPCCVHGKLDIPYVGYRDPHIASPKNYIEVYCNYKTPSFNEQEKEDV